MVVVVVRWKDLKDESIWEGVSSRVGEEGEGGGILLLIKGIRRLWGGRQRAIQLRGPMFIKGIKGGSAISNITGQCVETEVSW